MDQRFSIQLRFYVKNYNEEIHEGYFLEADVTYLEKLHELYVLSIFIKENENRKGQSL